MEVSLEWKVGDRVKSLFDDNLGDFGTIVKLNTYLNSKDQYCHEVKWDSGYKDNIQSNFHPKFLRRLTPLEDLL